MMTPSNLLAKNFVINFIEQFKREMHLGKEGNVGAIYTLQTNITFLEVITKFIKIWSYDRPTSFYKIIIEAIWSWCFI